MKTKLKRMNLAVLICVELGLAALYGCGPAKDAALSDGAAAEGKASSNPNRDAAKPGESGTASGQQIPANNNLEEVPRPGPSSVGSSKSAREVLNAMVAAYKTAKGYADKGELRLVVEQGGQQSKQAADYSVVMTRPNKIRLRVYDGVVVSNGKELSAFANNVPNQVVRKAAPAELRIKSLYSDEILAGAVSGAVSEAPTQGFSWVPIQALLLLADDPLKTLLFKCPDPELVEPAKFDDQECDRVQLSRPDGKAVLWIDRRSHVLRRLQFPTDEIVRSAPADQKLSSLMLSADFADARFEENVHPSAFEFEIPADNQVLDTLTPASYLMLGKPAPEFSFVGADGKPITAKSLKDKIVVLDFWATWCGPCRVKLPMVEKVFARHKDNDKVAFLLVSVDNKETPDKELQSLLGELNVTMPWARDPEQDAGKKLQISAVPATYIIGADGRVQDYQAGFRATHDADLTEKLKKLLAGEDIHAEPLKQLENERKQYLAWLETWINKGLFVAPQAAVENQDIPKVPVADRTEPKAFQLASLWKCSDLKNPGNMVVLAPTGGPPRVLVLDSWKSVAEVGADGKVLASHDLGLGEKEAGTVIRTGAGTDGKRFFAVFSVMQQQVHLYDEKWKKVLSFPESGPDAAHPGISDVQLADLDGDGVLKMYVGYFGDVGLQSVSLNGKRIWSHRALSNVSRLAVLGADSQGHRNLLCTNIAGSLVTLDSQGKRLGEVFVPDRLVHWVVSADLDGDNRPELAGLYLQEQYTTAALGLGAKSEELWTYVLPRGAPASLVEQIVPGNLHSSGPSHWLVPGPDGSIHVLGADGKLVDRFNYGETVTGLATLPVDGQPALVIGTPKGIDAWRVSWPAK